MWNILLSSKTVSCLSSVPDLSEYRVWLGVSDIREGAPDWSNRQEVSIAHVICGPEGSSLALIRLSKWVPGKTISKIYWCIYVCVCVCDVDHALYPPGPRSPQTMSTRFSYLWLGAPSQKDDFVKCTDGERPKVLIFYILLPLQLLYLNLLSRSPRLPIYHMYLHFPCNRPRLFSFRFFPRW